jgi:hypothetical protein
VDIVGFLFMLGAIAGFGYLVVVTGLSNPDTRLGKLVAEYWPFETPEWIRRKIRAREEGARKILAEATASPDPQDVIRETKAGNFIEIGTRELQYAGKMLFLELQWYGENKDNKVHVDPSGKKLREFTAALLSNGKLLFEQPMGDGQEVVWFLYNRANLPVGLEGLMKGTSDNPGPAARFAQSDQKEPVEYEFGGKTWVTMDIVWADVQVEGGKTFVGRVRDSDLARVVILLSQNANDESEWFMFCDLRSGNGSDTCWEGRKFDPDAEVDTV